MQYIAHRINSIDELNKVPHEYGVEIDIRVEGGKVVLGHDPDMRGIEFDIYLSQYHHKFLIANIKTEKIENLVLEKLNRQNINDYFFLDSSMSTIVQMSEKADRKFCARLSEFESIETVKLSNNLVDWVWVDCFTKLSLTTEEFEVLKKDLNKKICLTSPDLLGRPQDIRPYAEIMRKQNIVPDAICSKLENIHIWESIFPSH